MLHFIAVSITTMMAVVSLNAAHSMKGEEENSDSQIVVTRGDSQNDSKDLPSIVQHTYSTILTKKDFKKLFSLIKKHKKVSHSVSFNNCGINNAMAEKIAKKLPKLNIVSLELRGNDINSYGAKKLVKNANSKLKILDLRANPQIKKSPIASKSPTLKVLIGSYTNRPRGSLVGYQNVLSNDNLEFKNDRLVPTLDSAN